MHVLAGNFTLMLFNQMAGVSHSRSVKGSVACVQPRGQGLVKPGGGVGAYIWMFDGWELYVYGNFHVKCQMMFTG